MRGKSTPGYVLKVVASASIGCATLTACDNPHPVGALAPPPQPTADAGDPGITTTPPPALVRKVGTIASPPDDPLGGPTVGTTAHAPDKKP